MRTTRNASSTRVATVLALALVPFATLPSLAFAQGTEEQQQACTPDALKLCSDTIPDIGKTTACMKAHFSQLSPRCQTAFGEATGGAKSNVAKGESRGGEARSKTAGRKSEPRTQTATRAERRMPERAATTRSEREEASEPASRGERQAALPQRADTDPTVPPQTDGFPPFPSPDAPLVRSAVPSRSQIAQACRDGVIDAFTCQNTVPALLGISGY